MLILRLSDKRFFNEGAQEFVTIPGVELHLEHSLLSIRRWESKWKKSFFSSKLNLKELIDYVRCMSINSNVPTECYNSMSEKELNICLEYINDPMTSTTIHSKNKKTAKKETITSEIIYYNMLSLGIPFECEKWHINQLLTLMQVCSIKNNPKNKLSKRETAASYREINQARRKALNSKG